MAKEFFSMNRPDGRPEVYDVPPVMIGFGYRCVQCIALTGTSPLYPARKAFMCNPVDADDGQAHHVCLEHLPDNVVIFDPVANMCRSKDGQNTWREGEAEGDPLIKQLFDSETVDSRILGEIGKLRDVQ